MKSENTGEGKIYSFASGTQQNSRSDSRRLTLLGRRENCKIFTTERENLEGGRTEKI